MKKYCHFFGITFCLIFFLFSFSGCAFSPGSRFYPGKPLIRNAVAFLIVEDHCDIYSITKKGQNKKNFLGWRNLYIEILPGDYILELRHFYASSYNKEEGETIHYPLHAESGHVYHIVSELNPDKTWHPLVTDIVKNEDYEKYKIRAAKTVRERVDEYFKGERNPLVEKEFPQPRGRVFKYWSSK